MKRVIILGALALSGCYETTETAEDACGASGYQGLVGTPIAAATFPADLDDRVIAPGTAVTMDYVPTRINFELDDAGKITRIYCG